MICLCRFNTGLPMHLNLISGKEISILMKKNALLFFIRIFLGSLMVLCLVCSALAEVQPLDTDIMAHGQPLRKEGWISDHEYRDESIHILYERMGRKPKSSRETTICRWITIEISDPSQLRTAMSMDSYDDPGTVSAVSLAKYVNAAVALNGDYFKYNYDRGYVLRQGVLYRDALDGEWDSLIIDDQGDFHGVIEATSETMASTLKDLEAQGRKPMNVFTFGPVLIQDGKILREDSEYPSEMHYPTLATQRIALIQLDRLKYAVMEIDSDGGNGTGMNLGELARFILEISPDCKMAYNLDGGGSTHLILNGKQIHKTVSGRAVSDIIYFASAQTPEE